MNKFLKIIKNAVKTEKYLASVARHDDDGDDEKHINKKCSSKEKSSKNLKFILPRDETQVVAAVSFNFAFLNLKMRNTKNI